jgi:3-methyladenine DNA glycosylase AlkD
MSQISTLFEEIVKELTNHQNAEIAKRMEQYMRNQFAYFGIPSPNRTTLFQTFKPAVKALSEKELQVLVNRLWNLPQREGQYIAMLCLGLHVGKLKPEFLPFLESLITSKSWWDTVDWLAPNPCGKLFKKHPDLKNKYVHEWNNSEDIWLQRSALIFQLKYREETDFSLMKEFILEKNNDMEFFIQKACGWALRQYSKYNAKEVINFINDHPELSNLAKKEGLKWLTRNGYVN